MINFETMNNSDFVFCRGGTFRVLSTTNVTHYTDINVSRFLKSGWLGLCQLGVYISNFRKLNFTLPTWH